LQALGGVPFLGGGLALVEEGPGGLPEVFEDVDEVDDDRDREAAPGGLGGDGLDLGVVAVDENGAHSRLCCGSRRSASSKAAAMTAGCHR
jgi:hypothetical protein